MNSMLVFTLALVVPHTPAATHAGASPAPLPTIPTSSSRPSSPAPRPTALPSTGAISHAAPSINAAPAAPKDLLERYQAKMAHMHTPAVMTFEYSLEQAGYQNMTQSHRIYRSENEERDETLGNDGTKLKPKIRIYRNRPNTYAFEVLVPRKDTYAFNYVGKIQVGTHPAYLYRTTALGHLTAYTVTDVLIDGQTMLPAVINFETISSTATGRGNLHFSEVDGALVVSEVEATATVGKSKLRERLVFTNYHFPKALPSSTFGSF